MNQQQWSGQSRSRGGRGRWSQPDGPQLGHHGGGGGSLLGPGPEIGPQMPVGHGGAINQIGPVGPMNQMGSGSPMNQMGPGGPMNQMGPGGPMNQMGSGGPMNQMGQGFMAPEAPMGQGGMMQAQNNMPPQNMENVPPLLPPMLPGFMDLANGAPILLDQLTEIEEVNMEIINDGNEAGNRPGGDPANNGQGNEAQSHGGHRERRDRESDRDRSRRRSPRSRDRHDKDRGRRDRDRERDADRGSARSGRRRLDDNDLLHDILGASGRDGRARGRRGEQERGQGDVVQGMSGQGMPGQGMPGQGGIPGQGMMMPGQMGAGGMMQYPGQNMYSNNMMGQPMNNMGMQNMMPNMMMGQMGMYQQMNPMAGLIPNQTVFLMNSMLLPPLPGAEIPERRERPLGCRTIFVGGLPEEIQEENIREIFYRFGKIDDLKLNRKGFCHVRYTDRASVEASFILSGYRFKYQDQSESEATNLFIDYALNRDDQNEYEKEKKTREPSPPPIEMFSTNGLTALVDKIKSEEKFAEAAPTLAGWLERGECNKRNANTFYSLIQASNNQVRRLFNEKMTLDDELANMKTSLKDRFAAIIAQFEHVAKILSAARHQRVWDHFSKQQRRNIEMWQSMSVELDNLREEYNNFFEEDEEKQPSKKMVPEEKFEELKRENANLAFELEGYKNDAHVAKDEAERKFEKFKAHFIAQQALSNSAPVYPPLPPAPAAAPPPPPPPPAAPAPVCGLAVPVTEARLISVVTAFLLVHPLGASIDYIVSYLRSMMNVNQAIVLDILQKYSDVFEKKSSGVGASIETKWAYVTFDNVKKEPL